MREILSTVDLAFVYVDLGDDFYKYATHMMVQSARKAIPGVRIIQLTDGATKHYPDADMVLQSDTKADAATICVFKGNAIAQYAMQANGPVIFSDVDMLWRSKPPMPETGVGLMYRDGFPCMPFNTGLMISAGDEAARKWFAEYKDIILDLGKHEMGGWYADQIAAVICAGRQGGQSCRMDEICPAYGEGKGSAIHFKGPRKEHMREVFEAMQ